VSASASRLADDAALARVDARLAGTPRCDRCGIHLPHICTRDTLPHLASSRPGNAFAPPGFEDAAALESPLPARESVTAAAVRVRMDKARLKGLLLAAGLERGTARKWYVEPADVDRVIAEARPSRPKLGGGR
jgi:hypothetical protein